MFTEILSGTRAEIETALMRVKLPHDVLAHGAVCEYALAHIPKHTTGRFKLVLSVHSIANLQHSTLAGHISVVVTS
jgi:hypothetical protein